MVKRLNWRTILSNVKEAREELESIERRAKRKRRLSEEELQIVLRHAYHHLNVAWNARRVRTAQFARMTDREFRRWGRYPCEMEEL